MLCCGKLRIKSLLLLHFFRTFGDIVEIRTVYSVSHAIFGCINKQTKYVTFNTPINIQVYVHLLASSRTQCQQTDPFVFDGSDAYQFNEHTRTAIANT